MTLFSFLLFWLRKNKSESRTVYTKGDLSLKERGGVYLCLNGGELTVERNFTGKLRHPRLSIICLDAQGNFSFARKKNINTIRNSPMTSLPVHQRGVPSPERKFNHIIDKIKPPTKRSSNILIYEFVLVGLTRQTSAPEKNNTVVKTPGNLWLLVMEKLE